MPFHCPDSFNFSSLLQEATEAESALDDLDSCPAVASLKPLPHLLPAPSTLEPPQPSHGPYRLKRAANDPQTLDNARRKRKRAKRIAQNGHQLHPSTARKVVQTSTPVSLSADFADFPAAAGAYQAKVSRLLAADIPHSAASLSTQGLDYLRWNGR